MKRSHATFTINADDEIVSMDKSSGPLDWKQYSTERCFAFMDDDDDGDFSITVTFDGLNVRKELRIPRYTVKVTEVYEFLVDAVPLLFACTVRMYRGSTDLGRKGVIRSDDSIHITCGPDGYAKCSQEYRNRLMHALNGNIKNTGRPAQNKAVKKGGFAKNGKPVKFSQKFERQTECQENHGGHKAVDKKQNKINKHKVELFMAKRKAFEGTGKIVPEGNKPVHVAPKVSMEGEIDKAGLGQVTNIDNSIPASPNDKFPVDKYGNPIMPLSADAKMEKKELLTDVEYESYTGKVFSHNYEIEGDNNSLKGHTGKWFGLIPKFDIVPAEKDDWILMYFWYFVSSFLFLYFWTYDVDWVVYDYTKVLRWPSNFDMPMFGSGKNWVMVKFLIPAITELVKQLCCYLGLNLVGTLWIVTRLGVYVYIYYMWYKITNNPGKYLYTIRFLSTGNKYYTRSLTINEVFLMDEYEGFDKRTEQEKNFKLLLRDTHMTVTEKVEAAYPLGYYDREGKFVVVNNRTEKILQGWETYECSAELVSQMMSTKNTVLTLSPDAMCEKLLNSTNLGAAIKTDRSECFSAPYKNNSARVACAVALSMRFQMQNSISDQLFRNVTAICRLVRYQTI